MKLPSYPSIYQLGHAAIKDLFSGDVKVEEKLDGSQFSFMVDKQGVVHCRSKGVEIHIDHPEGMFELAVKTVLDLKSDLVPDWVYRGEYLSKPKHNTIEYSRVPNKHIAIFDINTGLEDYADTTPKEEEAKRLGLEFMPTFFKGKITSPEKLKELFETESFLGGSKIEGVVIKPVVPLYGKDKKLLLGKYVREEFVEENKENWKKESNDDVLLKICEKYRNENRWLKSIQHLKETGKIEGTPKDIGLILKEIPIDIKKECELEIKEMLFNWAWKKVERGFTKGFPAFYKNELLKSQFSNDRTYKKRDL